MPSKFRDILGVYAEVNLLEENGKHYLEIVVPRYEVPISVRGKYYLRTGTTLQELKGPALNEFILKRTGKTWDDIPVESATLTEIDEEAVKFFVRKSLKSNRITAGAAEEDTQTLLSNLHLSKRAWQIEKCCSAPFRKRAKKVFYLCLFQDWAIR